GTLVMPYCSGIGNLIFAFLIGTKGASGSEVLTNSLVNNVTNLTLVLGLPAVIWNMNLFPQSKSKKKKRNKEDNQKQEREVNRLSLLLTLTAALFFTGATWVVGKDGKIDAVEGVTLI